MSEEHTINRSGRPITTDSLHSELLQLGIEPGMCLLVHSSLSSLGWVCGGARAVVDALTLAVGDKGTLVMPTHSAELSDPVFWQNPPVPTNWWPIIRDSMPAFDPQRSATRCMGAIPELFRTYPGVQRSRHPQVSFAAFGHKADAITGNHEYDFALGEGSPLARVYEHDGYVLLLGVGFDNNTSLHLSEYRVNPRIAKPIKNGAPVLIAGERKWIELNDIETTSHDFTRIGELFAQRAESYRSSQIGCAKVQLMSQPELVDFGQAWMQKHR